MGRTLTAASELDLEPLEVRGGLQRRVRALLSLALPHVEKMPLVVPLASLKEGAPVRRAALMNETKKVASRYSRRYQAGHAGKGNSKSPGEEEVNIFIFEGDVFSRGSRRDYELRYIQTRRALSFGFHADGERPLRRRDGGVHPERHGVVPERRQRRVHQERPPVNLQLALAQNLRRRSARRSVGNSPALEKRNTRAKRRRVRATRRRASETRGTVWETKTRGKPKKREFSSRRAKKKPTKKDSLRKVREESSPRRRIGR